MRSGTMIRVIAAGTLFSGFVALGSAALAPMVPPSGRTERVTRLEQQRMADRAPADTGSASIVARDMFRLSRRPAAASFDPAREQVADGVPDTPRPMLVLLGLLDGQVPEAVLEGLPGTEGARIVRAGDTVGGLTVRRIGGGEVHVAGMDTVWVLRLGQR